MYKTWAQFTAIFSIIFLVWAFTFEGGHLEKYQQNESSSNYPQTVSEALIKIGAEKPLHYIEKIDPDSARMGEEMIKYGELLDGSNKRISKFFMCIDCHNLEMESADPADESPEAVLEYGKKNGLPFLPASTFYGMYNKEHWYNDDYYKKYGDLVFPTRDTLYNAIQLCATQCAKGRELEYWEVRSIMHYYKTLELKISDLKFSKEELDTFGKLLTQDKKEAETMLKGKYSQANRAHFGTAVIPEIEGYKPSLENGKYIYTYACLYCHDSEKGITSFALNDTELSLRFLYRKRGKYNHFAVPQVTRYGTYSVVGRQQYMPMYSFEKMSDKQLLDLLYYLEVGKGE